MRRKLSIITNICVLALKIYSLHLIISVSAVLTLILLNITGAQTNMGVLQVIDLFYYSGEYAFNLIGIEVHILLISISFLISSLNKE